MNQLVIIGRNWTVGYDCVVKTHQVVNFRNKSSTGKAQQHERSKKGEVDLAPSPLDFRRTNHRNLVSQA
jgi:hypothetical protein